MPSRELWGPGSSEIESSRLNRSKWVLPRIAGIGIEVLGGRGLAICDDHKPVDFAVQISFKKFVIILN